MRNRTIASGLLLAALSLAASCTKGFDEQIPKALSLSESGDAEGAAALIEMSLLDKAAVISSGPPYPACNGGVLFRPHGGRVELLHPYDLTLEGIDDVRTVSRDPASGIIAAGGRGLVIYSKRGRVIDNPDISASKDGVVRACAWTGSSLLFYSDMRLYAYIPSTGEVSPLSPGESFPPPFAGRFFTASIEVSGNIAVISVGIAGRYQVSAVNLTGGAVLFKNREAAGGRVFVAGKEIMTVNGSAGRWTVTALSFNGNKVRKPLAFNDLGNIAFFRGGVIYENKYGLWCAPGETTTPVKIPGSLRLYGQCGDHALLLKGDALYLVGAAAMIANISRGNAAAPRLFAP